VCYDLESSPEGLNFIFTRR